MKLNVQSSVKNVVRFFKVILPRVGQDILKEVEESQLLMVASSLAYTSILSIIPVLAVSFAIFQVFGGMQKVYEVVEPLILSNLAEGTSDEVIETLHNFISNTHAGAVGVGGLIALIFTSMSLLSSVEKAINMIWKKKVTRGLFQRISAYWLLITFGPLALSVAVGIATSSKIPLSFLLPSGTGMFLLVIANFYCVYKWVPQTEVKPIYALVAAVSTAVWWNLARVGYVFYTQHVVSYNKIYGSLGAIPILLLWIYIVWLIILGGAALSAALQRKTDGKSNATNSQIKPKKEAE